MYPEFRSERRLTPYYWPPTWRCLVGVVIVTLLTGCGAPTARNTRSTSDQSSLDDNNMTEFSGTTTLEEISIPRESVSGYEWLTDRTGDAVGVLPGRALERLWRSTTPGDFSSSIRQALFVYTPIDRAAQIFRTRFASGEFLSGSDYSLDFLGRVGIGEDDIAIHATARLPEMRVTTFDSWIVTFRRGPMIAIIAYNVLAGVSRWNESVNLARELDGRLGPVIHKLHW